MPDKTPPLDAQPVKAAAGLSHAMTQIVDNARIAGGSFAKVTKARYTGPKRPAAELSGLGIDIRFGEIDNPYFTRSHKEDRANPRKIQAAWNTNESPLVRLATRGTIDARQAVAGHMFRSMFERIQGGLGSPSNIQERVDGGSAPDVFTENRARASRQLAAAAEVLGASAYFVVSSVCGEGLSLNELARRNHTRPKTAREALKTALDRLAEHWDLGKPKRDG